MLTRRTFLAASTATLMAPAQAIAAPRAYGIAPGGATITYIFKLNGAPQRGTAPLSDVDIRVDSTNLRRSSARVTADMSKAKAGFVFITDALKSESVLNTQSFPQARFVSTRITLGADGRISNGAAIEGELTLRGVTRPLRLNANLYRASGSASGDLSRLNVRLTGALSRAAFGATGFPSLVEDEVKLDIRADIAAL